MKNLSIIVPVYNIESYIGKCLESINNELLEDCEVIIVDDGSNDNSYSIIEQYIKDKKDYILIRQKNAGLSGARNTGIKNAQGKYLLFVDGDDCIEKGAIESVRKIINKNTPDIIVNRHIEFDMVTEEKYPSADINWPDEVIEPLTFYDDFVNKKKNWISAWNCIVARAFIEKYDIYFADGLLHEDELWVPMIFSKAKSLQINQSFVHLYRVNREGSIMKSTNIKRELDKLEICKMLHEVQEEKCRKIFAKRISAVMLSVLISVATGYDEACFAVVRAKYYNSVFLLKNRYGWFLYVLVKMLGFDKCIRFIRIVRKVKNG